MFIRRVTEEDGVTSVDRELIVVRIGIRKPITINTEEVFCEGSTHDARVAKDTHS